MSGKYQAYPEYKDSGVEWLGHIPTDWELWKLTHAYEEIGSGTTPPSGSDEWYGGDVPWVTTGELRETEIVSTTKSVTEETLRRFPTLRKYPKGSIAIAMYGATIGRLGIFGIEATTNQACCVLTKSAVIDNKYLYYWLQAFKPDIVNLASGGGQPNINQEVVAFLKISSPEVSGQKKIANFLDHETAKIDTLIEKQQQLIALLKEKRQAVISHAVTKGLNPNAPMRDSGVEWLGEVPVHWGVSALKYHVDTVNGFGFSSSDVCEEGVPFIRAGNIKKKSVTRTNLYLPKGIVDRHKRVILSEGDIVISMVGSDPIILESAVGQIGIVPNSMAGSVPNQNVVILREKTDLLLKKFLFYALCSDSYRNHLNVFSHKLANQSIISSSLIVNAKFMLPSAEEQSEVIKFLDQRLTKFDEVMERNNYSLTLLKERRTALISAAVTGKIDVRSWIAPEPSDCKNKEAVG
jgi:type I restriction enzyme S subunit